MANTRIWKGLDLSPLCPTLSLQTGQNPTMQKPDGLLLVNDIIKYKATPTQGCVFSVWWLPQTVILHSWNCLIFKHAQEVMGHPNVSFCERMINFEQCSSLRSCLHCLNMSEKERNLIYQDTADFMGLVELLSRIGNFSWLSVSTSSLLTFQAFS